jgi:transporter family-2 protein
MAERHIAHPPGHPIAMVAALGVGGVIAIQSRINGEFGHVLNDGIFAAVLSFIVGLSLLIVIIAFRPSTREHLFVDLPRAFGDGRLRWWEFLGGLGGASVVASQTLTVPLLGVALFTVALVAGMTGSSLLVDRMGLAPGGKRAVTGPRVAGAVGTTLAVALAVSGRFSQGNLALWALLVTVAAGLASSFQQAVNAQIAVATRDPLVATFVNFVCGLTALVIALGLEHSIGHHAWTMPPAPWQQPILWLGGPVGLLFIVTAAYFVAPLGVLLFSLLNIAGQLVGALVLDLVVPTEGTMIDSRLVTGMFLTLVAVAVASYRRPAAKR